MSDPLMFTLTEVARAVREKRVSSAELTAAAIARARTVNGILNAFVRIDEEAAMALAHERDADLARGIVRGPLHGVPLAHKDMFYRAGQVSTCGSKIRADWKAPATAAVLERLDAAGAIQIGNLNMTEFAYGPTGQNAFLGDARNPWNTAHITGGSSSGSAVSVAARVVYGALGSDTAGSVRMPAALCGVTGMKTTFGRVSRHACMPLSQSLDTIGPLTRTVEDNALMLSVIAGRDSRDPSSLDVPVPDYSAGLGGAAAKGLRIGIARGFFDDQVEAPVARLIESAAATLRELGAQVIDVTMPDLDAVNATGFLLTWGDVIAVHGDWMRHRPQDYTAQTRGRIEVTLAAGAADYNDAQRARGRLLREFADSVFSRCDAVLAPILSFPVPKLSDVDVSGGPAMMRILDEITRLMRPVNVLGLPALALPCGFTEGNLPCGMQLIGRPFSEALLYRAGAAYQAATDWHRRAPAL